MGKKRIRLLKKGNVRGRHKLGDVLHCYNCNEELTVGIDDIISKMISSANSHTIYYSIKCAKELNIVC